MRRFYLPLLLLLLLTLPFRGMAAMGMSCAERSHEAPMAMSMGDMDMQDCEHMHDAEHDGAAHADHGCAYCADCCSMAMTGPIIPSLGIADFRSTPPTLSPLSYVSFQPENPERPPRHTA